MILRPDYNFKNVYEITPQLLLDMGVKAVFFDLDSTVMVSKSGVFTQKTLDLFEDLQKDFYIAIVTNNKNPEYTKKAKKAIKFKVIEAANKPLSFKMRHHIKLLSMKPKEVVIVGDRPLTDILGGKLFGMKTILVGSINENENKPTQFVRFLERLTICPF